MIRELWHQLRQYHAAVAGMTILVFFLLLAFLAPWIAPYDPVSVHNETYQVPPVWKSGGSSQFIFGTDDLGRDILSRLIYGAQVSLGVGFLVVIISLGAGTALGLLAGYRGGWTESIILRFVDILMSLPSILLAIVVVSILGPGLFHAILAVSIVEMPGFIRLVRGSVIGEKQKQYVLASQSYGASGWRQAVINILPNCLPPLIVKGTLAFSDGILNAAALGFLGLGAQPPTPEWGTMLSDARSFIESSPWLVTLPGLCILVVVLGFNLLGDALRDVLDPKVLK